MAINPNQFYNELKSHLERFQHSENPPKGSVTITGVPREGLTVKYQHTSVGPADPAEMAREAAKIVGFASVGTAGGAALGAIIGKIVFHQVVTRAGVASAGAAIGIPFLAPFALAGGALTTAAYAAYKIGRRAHEQERGKDLSIRLYEHMQEFRPSAEWPQIEIFVSVPGSGLSALWQPPVEESD